MRLAGLLFLASCAALPAAAQSVPPVAQGAEVKEAFVKATAEAAVADLATKLEESFVFPDKGEAYAAMLRANLAAGKYGSFADKEAFARAVTGDLQAVHKDGHLRVRVVPPEARGGPDARPQADGEAPRRPEVTNAVSKSGWLADGVAYIRFEGFPGNEDTMAAVRAFLAEHKQARTLIIDARGNGGGGLSEMDLLFAQIYSAPTTLVTMDTRVAVEQSHGSPIAGHPTLRQVAGPESIVRREHFVVPAADQGSLKDAKVYLLTSRKTFSAAEHLSLALKRTHRATLIGEATGGGAHYGGMLPLDKEFTYAAFIPVGRTFDPDTGESWEAVGVQPDVAVSADQALDEALKRAGLTLSGEEALAGLK